MVKKFWDIDLDLIDNIFSPFFPLLPSYHISFWYIPSAVAVSAISIYLVKHQFLDCDSCNVKKIFLYLFSTEFKNKLILNIKVLKKKAPYFWINSLHYFSGFPFLCHIVNFLIAALSIFPM